MIRELKPNLKKSLIGKTCKLSVNAPGIDKVYGFQNRQTTRLLMFQETHDLQFVFIDQEPELHFNQYLYCIAELPNLDNWYWYFLNQLIICEP